MKSQLIVHHRSGFAGARAMQHAAAAPPNRRGAVAADADDGDDTPLALTMGELQELIDRQVTAAIARRMGKGRAAPRDKSDGNGRRVSVNALNLPPECLRAPTVQRARGAGTIAALNRAMTALGRGGAQ